MNTKLTLRLDSQLISYAKQYAEKNGMSVSQIVTNYFQFLKKTKTKKKQAELPPITQSLKGILSKVDERDYKKYLEEKHLEDII